MKTLLNYLALGTVAVITASCVKTPIGEKTGQQPSSVYITIAPESMATGNGQGVQSDDNTVQTLEIFIFRNEGDDAGKLDTYKKIEGADLVSLSDIKIQSTTGAKVIYAIANSHKNDWKGVMDITAFKNVLANLQTENLKNFTMTGSVEATLQITTSVTFSISRLVSRVVLTGIKTGFTGTPYEGSSLKNVKVYLTNVVGKKYYANGGDDPEKAVLNYQRSVAEDVNGCVMTGMLYDDVVPDITDSGYTIPHYFYCYENLLQAETPENRFTRLVIQGDLNGHTYYYPVNINRDQFGYTAANGHAGVQRNTSYELEVTILRPGSLHPDEIVEHGVLTTHLNILDWITVPTVHVIF